MHAVLDGNQEVTAHDLGAMLKLVLSVVLIVTGGVGVLVFGGVFLVAGGGSPSAMLAVLAISGMILFLGVRLFQSVRRSG